MTIRNEQQADEFKDRGTKQDLWDDKREIAREAIKKEQFDALRDGGRE